VAKETLAWLRDLGLVDESEGLYRFFSPVFQRFVATQEVRLEPMTQKARLECVKIDNPGTIFKNDQEIVVTGTVLKGGQQVDVSPHELRLIACLKRERKIYPKAKIAEYVYYEDYEPGKGGPDPRIENLVRQVRKRLGDRLYIKAHWGQGYEFNDEC
jgi:DNA-binding response OmpR family regulator